MSSGAEGDHMRVKNRKTSRQWWDGFPVFEAVAIALTALCTHDCLDNPFLLDDLTKVRDNPDIRSLDGIPSILVYPYLQQSGGIELLRRNDPSRPVTFLSYAIDHSLHGPRPRGFRMTNIGLHLLNCIALRLLMRRLQCWVLSTSQSNHSWGVPEGASIMWLVSPLNVQACAYIYARSELLCTLFSLCSLILACNRTKSGVSLLLDAALFILSLASKQTALVLPALTLFVRTSCGHHLLSSPYNLALSLIYSTLAASYLWLRFEVIFPTHEGPSRNIQHCWAFRLTRHPFISFSAALAISRVESAPILGPNTPSASLGCVSSTWGCLSQGAGSPSTMPRPLVICGTAARSRQECSCCLPQVGSEYPPLACHCLACILTLCWLTARIRGSSPGPRMPPFLEANGTSAISASRVHVVDMLADSKVSSTSVFMQHLSCGQGQLTKCVGGPFVCAVLHSYPR